VQDRADFGSSEPPRQGPPDLGSTLRRHWWIVLLFGVLLAAAGAAVGRSQEQVYTAKSTLTVANVAYDTRSVPGFAQAAQNLASSYSQSIGSGPVVDRVAQELRLDPAVVRQNLSATPVPNSTLMTVSARGADAASAVKLNRSATAALVAYVQTLDSTRAERNAALNEFRAAVAAEAKAQDRLGELRAERKLDQSSVSLDHLAAAVQKQQTASLRADGARARYVALRQATPSADARRMTVLGQAGTAAGDEHKNMQRYAAIGLVAGLALGLAVALVLPRRRPRRERI
jgi:hypothetical protein